MMILKIVLADPRAEAFLTDSEFRWYDMVSAGDDLLDRASASLMPVSDYPSARSSRTGEI